MINHMIINISKLGNTSTTNRIAGKIQYKCITVLMRYILLKQSGNVSSHSLDISV